MPTTINKQRLLNQLFASQKKASAAPASEGLPVLEQFIYGLCRESSTREQADKIFHKLQTHFFDWNEVRVSSQRELEDVLADLPDAEIKAQRLISFLQEVFETTFSYDLEALHKKGLKQAAKHLARFQAANDYTVSWVVQHTLGGHAIPLDPPTLRTVRRLGLIDEDQEDPEAVCASLEHLVPKARAPLFGELISRLADDVCGEPEPNCPGCHLAADCATGQESASESVSVHRGSRPKPR